MKSALILASLLFAMLVANAGSNAFSVAGDKLLLNGSPFKVIGLRVSNALISDDTTAQLINNLDGFSDYGVNTVSVFLMGSRFGDVKGYRPDASLDPVYASRLARIIDAADARGMVVLVGCLYWSTSRASEDLMHWTQAEANKAVANTVDWLSRNNCRNVFVDVDNEGMAHAENKWDIGRMIDAGHAVNPGIMLAYNSKEPPPANADLLIHHSPKDNRRPWIETEGSPYDAAPRGYWGSYSKRDKFYNYIRIGRYTPEMKARQLRDTHAAIAQNAGYMLASTWLQCVAGEGVGGPFMIPGGLAENAAVDEEVEKVQKDAGILWWLQEMKRTYRSWKPPPPDAPDIGRPAQLDYRIIVTGGELLHGVYPDAHTHFLTRTLHPLGVHCAGSIIVDDVRPEMLEALRFATNGVGLVILTGGLGPTPNDITRETLAEFTGIPLREQPEIVADMERRSKQRKEQLRENLRRQAQVPTRGGYLKSSNGTAAGLVFEMDSTVIVALPGPPRELQPMVVNELVPFLRRRFGVRPPGASLTLRFVGVGQSQISQTIKDHVAVPSDVTITSLFEGGRVDFIFSLASNSSAAAAVLARLQDQIRGQLGEYLYGDDGSSLEEVVIRKLRAANASLVLAEVCTGGQLAAGLNTLAGASQVLAGDYAAPTEEILARLLGAQSHQWSASSPAAERAKGLALAAAQRTQSAWALAIGEPQAEADGARWAWAALKSPDGQVAARRLSARDAGDDARFQLVTQLLDFLRRRLPSP